MTRGEIYTIPAADDCMKMAKMTEAYQWPNTIPEAIVGVGVLSDQICDAIIEECDCLEAYEFTGCHATTRELPRPLSNLMSPIIAFGKEANASAWNFDLSTTCAAWYQTYHSGDSYQIHKDGALGQSRKLTTVALLSDPDNYDGGVLRVIPWPMYDEIPRVRGTMVTYPSWMLHEVSEVRSGLRQTINLGYYGPPFR